MATFRPPSAAVLSARARDTAGKAGRNFRIEWFVDKVEKKIDLTMKQRVTLATAMVQDKVIRNISSPVTKGIGPRGGRVVTDRSKSSEFPKADTTQLMKTIFSGVRKIGRGWNGFVGTPLDYGLILETVLNRSFLVRTLNEMRSQITRVLTGPIR